MRVGRVGSLPGDAHPVEADVLRAGRVPSRCQVASISPLRAGRLDVVPVRESHRRNPREDGRLEVVAGRVGEQRRDAVEPDAVRDEPLPRIGAAREEGERRADVPRRVVEGAAQRQLLVVEPVGVDAQLAPAPARRSRGPCRPGGRARPPAARPPRCRPPRSRRPRPRRRRSCRRRAARARGAPAARRPRLGRPPASATQAQSISPIGPAPRIATRSPGSTSAARRRAGSRRAARPSPPPRARARRGRGGGSRARSAPGRAGTRRRRRSAARRLAARSSPAARVGRDHAPPVATSMPQNSCPNGLGSSPSRTGWPRRNAFRSVPSVSATSTWTSTSPGPAPGAGRPRAAGRPARGSAAPSRREDDLERAAAAWSSRPSSKRSSGSTVGSGRSSSGSSATRLGECRGVAEREPISVSSRR